MRTQLFTTALSSLLAATILLAAGTGALPQTTTVTLHIPPTQALPNPRSLPPSTHATLTSFHAAAAAYLTPLNTFVFRNVTEGSYLLDVHSLTHAFAPLRVDVVSVQAGADDGKSKNSGGGDDERVLKVSAWETFRGNDWNNKGEAVSTSGGSLEVRVFGGKAFYMERSSFNILNILKNPMILLGLVSMGIFVGMPYLVDNMDPEMRKEWEESQKNGGPMAGLMGGGGGAGGQASPNPIQNFDMAAFLAGSNKDSGSGSGNSGGSSGAKKEKGGKR